ncbi:MAG: winged helix-turn-helix transcriptional regulator [Clostridiales bacterium]|nr:winged helix-turn-helix transcriptional regulator [Clostridiales bacterium]
MKKRFENFTITILKLNKLIQKIKLYEMSGYNLKAIHVMCLHCLSESPSGLTASELCKLTLEDKAAISRALDLLREKGYVEYTTGYNSVIRLAEEGKKIAEFIAEKAAAAVAAGGKDLSEDEREAFYRALHSIAGNLEKYYVDLSEKTNGKS